MADDRIYMQCNICGKKLYLGKQFGSGAFYWYNYGKENNEKNRNNPLWVKQDEQPLEYRLNEFFDEHCHPCEGFCKWNGNFSIVYEMDDNPGLDWDDVWKPYQFNKDDSCKGCKGIKGFCEGDTDI